MNQALLIIDIQNDYFEGGLSPLCDPLSALANAEAALGQFRAAGLPVIHVQHVNTREGATFFLPDTDGVQIHKNLTPHEDEFIVVKHTPNSFYQTNLTEIINWNKIASLVVCGMMSHMCIDTTVRAAKDHDLSVTLLEDACTTKDLSFSGEQIEAKTVHKTFIAALNGIFAKVIKTNELILD
ncbi:MAG: cysteine hydrolase family protein [Eubacteriales bacterium]